MTRDAARNDFASANIRHARDDISDRPRNKPGKPISDSFSALRARRWFAGLPGHLTSAFAAAPPLQRTGLVTSRWSVPENTPASTEIRRNQEPSPDEPAVRTMESRDQCHLLEPRQSSRRELAINQLRHWCRERPIRRTNQRTAGKRIEPVLQQKGRNLFQEILRLELFDTYRVRRPHRLFDCRHRNHLKASGDAALGELGELDEQTVAAIPRRPWTGRRSAARTPAAAVSVVGVAPWPAPSRNSPSPRRPEGAAAKGWRRRCPACNAAAVPPCPPRRPAPRRPGG